MQRRSLMRGRASCKTWLGAALAVWLLLAESFAVTHPFDQAAHTDGQPCAVCLGLADLGAGAAAADVVSRSSMPLRRCSSRSLWCCCCRACRFVRVLEALRPFPSRPEPAPLLVSSSGSSISWTVQK